MTTLFSDSFTYSDGDLDTVSSSVWDDTIFGDSWEVISNEASSVSTGRNFIVTDITGADGADVTCDIVVDYSGHTGGTTRAGIVFDATDSSNYLYFEVRGNGDIRLYQVVSGSSTQLALDTSSIVTMAAGDSIRVQRTSSNIIISVDQGSGFTEIINYSGSWTPVAATQWGLVSRDFGVKPTFDSFEVTTPGSSGISGTASSSLSFSGSSSGRVYVSGESSSTITLTGSSSGQVFIEGEASSSFSLNGSSSSGAKVSGTTSGDLLLSGSSSGNLLVQGSTSGEISLTGSSGSVGSNSGAIAGSLPFSGSSEVTALIQGLSSGNLAFSGSGEISSKTIMQASGSLGFTGQGQAGALVKGLVAGSIDLAGTASAQALLEGIASGLINFTGDASNLVTVLTTRKTFGYWIEYDKTTGLWKDESSTGIWEENIKSQGVWV